MTGGETAPPPAPAVGDESAPGPEPPEDACRRWPARAKATVIALAALSSLLLLVAAGAVPVGPAAELDRTRNDRRRIEEVAGRFATSLLTYDYRQLDQSRERVLSLATGRFRREYRAEFPALETLFKETKAKSTGQVSDVFTSTVDDGAATAVVVYDVVAEGVSGRRRESGSYLRLELLKVAGKWRVDDVVSLTFTAGTSGGAPSTTPTSRPGGG